MYIDFFFSLLMSVMYLSYSIYFRTKNERFSKMQGTRTSIHKLNTSRFFVSVSINMVKKKGGTFKKCTGVLQYYLFPSCTIPRHKPVFYLSNV